MIRRCRKKRICSLLVWLVCLGFMYVAFMKLTDEPEKSPFHEAKNRYLIYTCRLQFCGGFSDIMKGIYTTYKLSNKTGRLFRIEQTDRCTPITFLRPNRFNWIINEEEISGLDAQFYSSTRQFKEKNDTTTNRHRNDFVYHLNESIVYLQTNTLANISQYADEFKAVFEELFVLEQSIEDELRRFRETFVKKNRTACAQIRTGKHQGFEDPYYNNLGNITAIWDFLSSYDRAGYVIFVASDSNDIKLSANRRFTERIVDIPGKSPYSSNVDDDKDCLRLRKIFLDILFLSKCDILLLTYSGIGLTSSGLRGKEEGQFCFQNHVKGVYPCPRYNLRWKRSREEDFPLSGVW